MNVNTGREVDLQIYRPDGSYDEAALALFNETLECRRTGTQAVMEPQLVELLAMVQEHFGGRDLFVLSGFRNQRKTTSRHFHATAVDFSVDGIPARTVYQFVESLDQGGLGVGIYPRRGFVHLDVRGYPSFRWTDFSGRGAGEADRAPPRGLRRRRES